MARRLAPFMLVLVLCALPAAAAKPPQRQPLDPDALAFLTGETFFTSGSRVVVCSEVDLAAANARTNLQKGPCTVWLTCPDGYTTRTCSSQTGNCSSKCGFVKCDGVKDFCPTPCCERAIYCPDGTPISCQAFGGNQCSQTSTSVTCNGETISCPFNCTNYPFSPQCIDPCPDPFNPECPCEFPPCPLQ